VAAGDDIAGALPADAINATVLKDTVSKQRRAGPSACKRKEARTAQEVPAAINDEVESADEDADIAPDDDDDAGPTMPEVSDDEGGVHGDDDDSAESVTLQPTAKSQPPASAENVTGGQPPASTRSTTGGNDESEDDKNYTMEALGNLTRDPLLVGSIFTRQAEDEQFAGLDVAAKVWETTKQLLGDSSAAQKLAWAMAASKERAYLVVMGGDRYFTLIHHLTIMDAELRPKDPVKGKLTAFEAEMRDQGPPPRLVVFDGPAKDLFEVLRPQIGLQRTADTPTHGWGRVTTGSWAYEPLLTHPLTGPLQRLA
jgi:hypothetical protein